MVSGGIGNSPTKIGNNPPASSSGPSYSQVVQQPDVSESSGILEKVGYFTILYRVSINKLLNFKSYFNFIKLYFDSIAINCVERRSHR